MTSVGKTTEVVEFNCSVTAPVVTRTTFMTFRGCSGFDQVNLEIQLSYIEDAIKVSLNELLATFCNRESRNITAVSFLGAGGEDDGNCASSKYFFSVDFNCRGCPLGIKLVSNTTSRRALVEDWSPGWGDGTSRRLSGGSAACFCDIGLIDNRGPSESEVSSNAICICHLNDLCVAPINLSF